MTSGREKLAAATGAWREDKLTHLSTVAQELREAMERFEPFNSPHEGYAVLLEEVMELQAEVFKNPQSRSTGRMREEARQVAAMAIRFMTECT